MDNLPMHKVADVEERSEAAIEAAGVRPHYLPSCSPDLNAVEKAFSKFKAPLLKAAEHTAPGLLCRMGRITRSFNPTECRIFLRHAGCVQT